jgi:hypothetical protein
MGYLAFIDQAGKALHLDGSPAAKSDFERILLTLAMADTEDAAALYALRCAMVHSFGLANVPPPTVKDPVRRTQLQHFFELAIWDGPPVVQRPSTQWGGDALNVAERTTRVSLLELGNLAELVASRIRDGWLEGEPWTLNPELNPAEFRRRYFFSHPDFDAL